MKLRLSCLEATDTERHRQQKDIFILLSIAFIVWLIYFLSNFNGLKGPDAMHYASIARNIITGKGMLASDIYPGEIALLKNNCFTPVRAMPLHPFIIAIFFFIFGVNDYAVAVSSGIFYLLAVPIIYLLARELFGRKVGIVSTLLYIINLELLNYSISGLTESLFIFLLLLSFLTLYKSFSTKGFLLVGVILGLSRLTRINAIVFILPFMAYIYLTCNNRKITNILMFLAGFVIMSFPIMYRDYLVFNDPIFSGFHYGLMHFKYSTATNARTLLLFDPPSMLSVILSNLPGFIKAYVNNMHRYYGCFLGITKPLIMSFFIVGIFRWYEDKKINGLKLVFLSSIIIQMLMLSVSEQPVRYFHIFIPLIIIYGVEYLICIFEGLPFKAKIHRYLVTGFLLIFLSGPFFYYLTESCHDKLTTNEKQRFYWVKDFLENNTSPKDIIATNYWPASWYGNRRTVSLPITFKEIEEIDAKFLPIDAIFLSSDTFSSSELGSLRSEIESRDREWKNLLHNAPKRIGNFLFVKTFDDGKTKAALFVKEKSIW